MNEQVLKSKQEAVVEIAEQIKAHAGIIVAEYRGLTVAEISELRRTLAKDGAKLTVYKNSLVSRAVDSIGHEGLNEFLTGPNAIIFTDDVIKGPKAVAKFAKRHDNLVIKGGLAEGKIVNKDEIITLSKLPGREGLLSMLCSVLQAPIRNFAYAVQCVADKQN